MYYYTFIAYFGNASSHNIGNWLIFSHFYQEKTRNQYINQKTLEKTRNTRPNAA